MSVDENKRLNLRWIQAWNDRDWATEEACRAPDYVAHMSGVPVPLDAAGWGAFMGAFTAAFPDAQISVADSFGERDMVATRWTITGTHRGDFQGVPPTGRPVTMAGVDISRFVDGKVAEHWAQFDVMGVMQQIGAIPAPPR
jgi:steroid delta-isomerase-like uncharacterized protein